jgi:hypothetical protein
MIEPGLTYTIFEVVQKMPDGSLRFMCNHASMESVMRYISQKPAANKYRIKRTVTYVYPRDELDELRKHITNAEPE